MWTPTHCNSIIRLRDAPESPAVPSRTVAASVDSSMATRQPGGVGERILPVENTTRGSRVNAEDVAARPVVHDDGRVHLRDDCRQP